MLNTKFNKINLNESLHHNIFIILLKMLPTGYSITVNIDITNTYNMIRQDNKKFFPAYLYIR